MSFMMASKQLIKTYFLRNCNSSAAKHHWLASISSPTKPRNLPGFDSSCVLHIQGKPICQLTCVPVRLLHFSRNICKVNAETACSPSPSTKVNISLNKLSTDSAGSRISLLSNGGSSGSKCLSTSPILKDLSEIEGDRSSDSSDEVESQGLYYFTGGLVLGALLYLHILRRRAREKLCAAVDEDRESSRQRAVEYVTSELGEKTKAEAEFHSLNDDTSPDCPCPSEKTCLCLDPAPCFPPEEKGVQTEEPCKNPTPIAEKERNHENKPCSQVQARKKESGPPDQSPCESLNNKDMKLAAAKKLESLDFKSEKKTVYSLARWVENKKKGTRGATNSGNSENCSDSDEEEYVII